MAWTDPKHDEEWIREPDVIENHRSVMRRVIAYHKQRNAEGDERARMWLNHANELWNKIGGNNANDPRRSSEGD